MNNKQLFVVIGPDTLYSRMATYLCRGFGVKYAYVFQRRNNQDRIRSIHDEPLLGRTRDSVARDCRVIGFMVPDALLDMGVVDAAVDSLRALIRVLVKYCALSALQHSHINHEIYDLNFRRETRSIKLKAKEIDGYISDIGVVVYRSHETIRCFRMSLVYKSLFSCLSGEIVFKWV
jgi:hypothetical protein